MKHRQLFALAISPLCLLPLSVSAQSAQTTQPALSVAHVIRTFAAAHDAGNGQGMAQVFDTGAAVTFVQDGDIRRGAQAIRAYLDSLAEPARLYGAKLDVQSIDVVQLGADYALAIVKIRDILNADEWPGTITALLHRASAQWRVINMHKSGHAMAGE